MGQFSNAQLVTLKNAINAETDVTFVSLRTAGATGAMAEWYNGAISPVQKVWNTATPAAVIDEASNWTAFDTLSQGKRDSWAFFFNFPRDFTRGKVRSWVTDVWGSATGGSDSEKILLAAQRDAKRGEIVFGGTTRTTGTASALELNWAGSMRSEDVIAALGGSY